MYFGLKSGLLGGAAVLALAAGAPAYAQDDLSGLRQQLETMKERLAKLEADKAEKRRVSAAAAVEAGDKPRSWKLPGTNTSMNIGGFVKFSAHLNFTGAQSGNGQQSNEGSGAGSYSNNEGTAGDRRFNGGTWDFTARRSRFWIQTWTPTDWGELRTYFETDFVARVGSTSNPAIASSGVAIGAAGEMLRLRHAYGTLGPILVGKTSTLFGGTIGAPEVLDDGAPLVLGSLRIPQIRYTHNFGGGLTLAVALEDAGNISDAGTVVSAASCSAANVCAALSANAFLGVTAGGVINGPQRWPDVVAALQWSFPGGALYATGMVGMMEIDNGTTAILSRHDDAIKWAGSLGARYDFGRVEIGGQGYIGQGIGNKYTGPTTAFLDAVLVTSTASNAASLRPVTSYGGVGYVQVKLTDTIRSTAAFSWGMQEAASEVPGYYGTPAANSKAALTGATNYYWSGHANLLWNPVPQVTFGAEYSYQFAAKYNGPNIHVQRLQFSAIYRF